MGGRQSKQPIDGQVDPSSQNKQLFELQIGPCKLKVIQGLLEHSKEDAIVNSTNESCDFQQNASAKALAEAAGPGLKAECSKFGKLVHGEVRHSDAYNLQCKKVLHVWMEKLDSKSPSEKDFGRIITECLCVADQDLMLSSVAFPALGTGVLKFPADFLARCFMRSLKGFTSHYDVRCLRDITIVIPPSDTKAYQDELGENPELLRSLDQSSEEFLEVQDSFKKSVKRTVSVSEIIRVQNLFLWKMYKERRRMVSASLDKCHFEVEQQLYHETPETIALEIANRGFCKDHAGTNGRYYGEGCYFARDAEYSHHHKYSTPIITGMKCTIRARVIVGEYVRGNPMLKDTPKKISGEKYDSVVDNVQNPTIFVVFNDTAAYPEYIIKYKS